jgi:predicted glycosyltransferase
MNVLFHVQHLLGIGHERRAAAIVRALIEAGHRVVLLRGGFPGTGTDYGLAEVVQLPPVRAADASFHTLIGADGRPVDEAWWAARERAVLDGFFNCSPDIVLIESYPFARTAFAREIEPLLAVAREENIATVASVRDILVAKTRPGWADTVAETVERLFDAVLVHSDPDLVPFAASFPAAGRLGNHLRHTGYVTTPTEPAALEGDGAGEVVVSVGGGAVGLPLLRAALAARARTPLAEATWRLLVGPDLPDATLNGLSAAAPDGVIVERARPDFPQLLARCRLSISQAGYNTVLDLLQAGCPAVLAPFATAKETEQALRARLLAARGRALMVETEDADEAELARRLADAVAQAAATSPAFLTARLDGAAQTVAQLESIWRRPTWDDLRAELDRWAEMGRAATFWWRDDDVERPSPEFARMMALSQRFGVPLALAAISGTVEGTIRPLLRPDTRILQHGHTHAPHVAPDGWTYEFSDDLPLDAIKETMRADRERLECLFDGHFLPVMVPPWNRLGRAVAAALPEAGLTGLTTFRHRRFDVPGVREVNTHIDPINWRDGARFTGDGPALNGAIAHLRARRRGVRPEEATGLMTHHLQMKEETWAFVERLFAATTGHPAVRWLDATEVFGG